MKITKESVRAFVKNLNTEYAVLVEGEEVARFGIRELAENEADRIEAHENYGFEGVGIVPVNLGSKPIRPMNPVIIIVDTWEYSSTEYANQEFLADDVSIESIDDEAHAVDLELSEHARIYTSPT